MDWKKAALKMSQWLQNVGNFLEKLDGEAERVVDEQLLVSGGNDDNDDQDIANILATRGLHHTDSKEEELNEGDEDILIESEYEKGGEPDGEATFSEATKAFANETEELSFDDSGPVAAVWEEDDVDLSEQGGETTVGMGGAGRVVNAPEIQNVSLGDEAQRSPLEGESPAEEQMTSLSVVTDPTEAANADHHEQLRIASSGMPRDGITKQLDMPNQLREVLPQTPQVQEVPEQTEEDATTSTSVKPPPSKQKAPPLQPKAPETPVFKQDPRLHQQLREAQKESRTLRRHVVSLNSQLETAEAEVQAQREELERAAERMEKDRMRSKQERDAERARNAAEIDVLKKNHERAQSEAKRQADALLDETRKQLKEQEHKRMQEGGNWNKELEDVIAREQETLQKLVMLEDEKGTLLSQISTLQAQQEALGSRLESLTQTADSAMAREREADVRLDETLTLHARQIGQRNAREAELEKTVAELGAALVAARGKSSVDQKPGDSTSQNSPGRESLETEIEVVRTQLAHERQRTEALQQQFQEMTKERTDEAAVVTSRQLQFDRKVAEMSQEISHLKRQAQQAKESRNSFHSNMPSSSDDANQIKSLSEEVLRQRETAIGYNSEISALKSRLKVALARAEQAEAAATENVSHASDPSRDIERGGSGVARRRGARTKKSPLMKEVFQLDSFQSPGSQRLGKSLDVLDDFLAKSGTVLRYNPLARFFFSK